jgi:hypothetical protein
VSLSVFDSEPIPVFTDARKDRRITIAPFACLITFTSKGLKELDAATRRPNVLAHAANWLTVPWLLTEGRTTMDEDRLLMMNIASNILACYYSNKVCYCVVNNKEPDDAAKEDLLKRVISMFENLSTSYLDDIKNIAEGAK